jgi:DNA mismatch repair protein MutL
MDQDTNSENRFYHDGPPIKRAADEAKTPQQTIQLLSPEVIHRIAAGEIVDRPASILKELMENSIDAASKTIKVTLVAGGLTMLKVDDDGRGISEADLRVCLKRHATSKIRTVEDLDQIFSLGFRGEALAATSSVSRLKIESLCEGSQNAFSIESVGSSEKSEPKLCSRSNRGTSVTVSDLFFNVPARLKFVKKPNSELAECLEVFRSIALTYPEVTFSVQWLDSKGEIKGSESLQAESPMQRFSKIAQINPASSTVDSWHMHLDSPAEGIQKINLWVYPPPHVGHQQKNVRLSVNGRWVFDKRLPFAAREAFLGLIEVGTFPKLWVDIHVDPQKIDVNIHPQKKEIRWPTDFSLASFVYKILRNLIAEKTRHLESQIISRNDKESGQLELTQFSDIQDSLISPVVQASTQAAETAAFSKQFVFPKKESPRTSFSNEEIPMFRFDSLRVVGEVGACWLVCESPLGLILIDQHAAHERVEFDRYMKKENLFRPTPLAIPMVVELPVQAQGRAREVESLLEDFGFEFSDLSQKVDSQIELLALPRCDRSLNWGQVFEEIFEALREGELSQTWFHELKVKVASSLACHGSVRKGQRLSNESIKELLSQMSQIAWGGYCPHGRPVWKLIRHEEIENFFHR